MPSPIPLVPPVTSIRFPVNSFVSGMLFDEAVIAVSLGSLAVKPPSTASDCLRSVGRKRLSYERFMNLAMMVMAEDSWCLLGGLTFGKFRPVKRIPLSPLIKAQTNQVNRATSSSSCRVDREEKADVLVGDFVFVTAVKCVNWWEALSYQAYAICNRLRVWRWP